MPRKKPGQHLQTRKPESNPVRAASEREREVVSVASQYSGPLPHPDHFDRYDQVLPGAADRILSMAENEGKQRRFRALLETLAYVAAVGGAFWLALSRFAENEPLTAALIVSGSLIAVAVHRRN